jgi:Na+/melibiose symporter-like transporter
VVILIIISFIVISTIPSRPVPVHAADESFKEKLTAGLRFVFRNQVLVGAMSLDMFAVLFGGAVAILPAICRDVLFVGPQELGLLRSSTAIGSILMGFVITFYPPHRRTGYKLLWCVAGYGACMICFAFSRNFYLSFILLMLSGAFDNVSMVIRGSISQLMTPDAMRGRVSAVNGIFIGSSNEIGSFESGVAAKLLGLIPSIIFGGSMTLLVVSITSRIAPQLRRFEIRNETSKS